MKFYLNGEGRKIYYAELGQKLYGNYFVFKIRGKYGLQTGGFQIIVLPTYDEIKPAYAEHFWGRVEEWWTLYDFNNITICDHQYRSVAPFTLQYALISTGANTFGFIDRACRLVIPEIYAGGTFLGLDYFAVYIIKNDIKCYGIIDLNGNIVRPFSLKKPPTFSETILYILSKRKPLREWLKI